MSNSKEQGNQLPTTPPAGAEIAVTTVTPLSHEELLNLDHLDWPFLSPGQIPVHPSVWRSHFLFTPDFWEEAFRILPAEIITDLEIAQGITGKDFGVEVDEHRISRKRIPYRRYEGFPFADLEGAVYLDQAAKYLRLRLGEPAIILDPYNHRGRQSVILPETSMLPRERLKHYNFVANPEEPQAITWYSNNVNCATIEKFFILRNLSIVVDKVGFEWLAQGKK